MFEILKEPDMIAQYGSSICDQDQATNFVATFRWLTEFMKTYNLVLRRHIRISQKLLEQTEELLANFSSGCHST